MLGVDTNGVVRPIAVDNATGYMLVSVSGVTSVSPSVNPTEAARDDNRVPVMLATDESSGEPSAMLIDNRSGQLWINQA